MAKRVWNEEEEERQPAQPDFSCPARLSAKPDLTVQAAAQLDLAAQLATSSQLPREGRLAKNSNGLALTSAYGVFRTLAT